MSKWTNSPLGQIANLVMGQSPESKFYTEEEIGLPFLQGCAEFQSRFPRHTVFCSQIKKIAPQNSILFSVRAPVGRINIADKPYIIGRGLAAITGTEVEQDYLEQYLYFEESNFRNASQGSTFEAINSSELSIWPIEHPTDKSEQSKIAEVLSKVDLAIEQTESLIAKQQRIKTGLMQDLLTRGIDEHGNLRSEETHKFKDSPLGRIPMEWEVVTVGKVSKSLVPGRDKPDLDGGGIPWITIPDIEDMYINAAKTGLSLSPSAIKAANARLMPKGTVLMSCVGEFGITAIATVDVVANQQLHGFVCDQNIFPEWLVVQIAASSQRIDRMATQTTIKYLNKTGCESILIALPDWQEQGRSILLLRKVLALLKQQRMHLKKFQALKTALMQDLLTGKIRVTPLMENMEASS